MFRSSRERIAGEEVQERVTSVLGEKISWKGEISGEGGIRIEGAFDGDIEVNGLVIVAEAGRVSCNQIRADTVIVAGSVKGDILAQRVRITETGRVWGSVVTASFSTEEGAFLKGQITMEEQIDLSFGEGQATPDEQSEDES
jgi:cytoskeletal protein CcmA (bactofilin family)